MPPTGNVVLTTTTFYRDPLGNDQVRFELACRLVDLAAKAGHTVVIVDGSPETTPVRRHLADLGAHIFPQTQKGMGASRREVWRHAGDFIATDTVAILWTEPEKVDIVRFIPDIVAPLEQYVAPVVIPSRSQKSWETYPEFQRDSEQVANLVYNNLFQVDQPFDPMFGPVCFEPGALPCFAEFDCGWLWLKDNYIQHYIPLFMRSKGLPVASIEVDFNYPPAQKLEEETGKLADIIRKRFLQQRELITDYFLISCELRNLQSLIF